MISWTGWGILTPALFGLAVLTCQEIAGQFGQSTSGTNLGTSIGCVVGGVAVWFVGRALNRPKLTHDRATGRPVLSVNHHRLFGIPMQFYAVASPVAAVLTLIQAIHT